jgi:hypothetical protein
MTDEKAETEQPPAFAGGPRWTDVGELRGGERVWRVVGVQSITLAGDSVIATFEDGTTETYQRGSQVPLA